VRNFSSLKVPTANHSACNYSEFPKNRGFGAFSGTRNETITPIRYNIKPKIKNSLKSYHVN
jgi:hypothetical protein